MAGKIRILEKFGLKIPKFWTKIAKNQFFAPAGGRRDLSVKFQVKKHKILRGIEMQNLTVQQLVPEILLVLGLCYTVPLKRT